MREEGPSITAGWVAGFRTLGRWLPAGARLADDPWGARFVGAPAPIDSDADGTVDRRITLTYDEMGNLLLEEIDDPADGTVDETATYDYSCF